jgi:hypothetical protein
MASLIQNRTSGLAARVSAMRDLLAAWQRAVPPSVGERCFPMRIDPDGTLVCGVVDAIWIMELQMSSAEILGGLQREMPRLRARRLRFETVEPQRTPPVVPPPPVATRPPAPVTSEALARIVDPRLRRVFARMAGRDDDEAST